MFKEQNSDAIAALFFQLMWKYKSVVENLEKKFSKLCEEGFIILGSSYN